MAPIGEAAELATTIVSAENMPTPMWPEHHGSRSRDSDQCSGDNRGGGHRFQRGRVGWVADPGG